MRLRLVYAFAMDALHNAITTHGAQAVYEAAHRHMAGDTARGLATVGLSAHSLLEAWHILDTAHQRMTETQRAIEAAQASAKLETFRT